MLTLCFCVDWHMVLLLMCCSIQRYVCVQERATCSTRESGRRGRDDKGPRLRCPHRDVETGQLTVPYLRIAISTHIVYISML
jgi:hypothetical protein